VRRVSYDFHNSPEVSEYPRPTAHSIAGFTSPSATLFKRPFWTHSSNRLMGRNFGLEDQVTALLMDDALAPIAAQCFSEITAFEISRQFHA
jgi:hypothetical protein